MPKWLKIVLLLTAFCVLSVFAFVWYLDANTPKRNRYFIPESYAGWLCIRYAVPNAPALPIEDGFRVVRFNSTGVVETSDEGMPGKLRDEYFVYSPQGMRSLNVELEMGGGFTVSDPQDSNPGRYTFYYWVSRNAKVDQPPYSPEAFPPKCGPQ